MTDLIGRLEAFISAFAAAGDRLRNAAEVETIVRRKLAAESLDEACRTYDRDVVVSQRNPGRACRMAAFIPAPFRISTQW
ncbi:hypothetical protein [Bradyrhizobium ottawaense]|uniref:hypothetical protein n=1 Tax=Bradyrhizobium ottawaense TaxID=931866 RepID=UPI00383407B6